jgi:hypothetical protein
MSEPKLPTLDEVLQAVSEVRSKYSPLIKEARREANQDAAKRRAHIRGLAQAAKQIQIEESQLSLFKLKRRSDEDLP